MEERDGVFTSTSFFFLFLFTSHLACTRTTRPTNPLTKGKRNLEKALAVAAPRASKNNVQFKTQWRPFFLMKPEVGQCKLNPVDP
jgi:hypothetical protein